MSENMSETELKQLEEIDKFLTQIYNLALDKDEDSVLKILRET